MTESTDRSKLRVGMSQYPRSIKELDLDSAQFPPAAIDAMRRLARSRPWRGTISPRQRKLRTFAADLSAAYGLPAPTIIFDLKGEDSDRSCYYSMTKTVALRGRNLSVISLTHEVYHHILGGCEHDVCRHSLGLFKKCFPKSWSRLRFEGHMARRATD